MSKIRLPQKHTKIVATIGPATESETVIALLMRSGMDVARFNTKHGTPQWHQERIKRVRKVANELAIHIAILLDLQGPEIRINTPGERDFNLTVGDVIYFTDDENLNYENKVYIPKIAIESLNEGNVIFADDGLCEFKVITKRDKYLKARAVGEFTLKHRKTLNTPGVMINMPSLTDKDCVQLDGVTNDEIDYVGLSYVRNKKDILHLKKELTKRGINAGVIAKIENQAALDNIDEIIETADAVMVARGDLAIEVPFQQLTYWQKLIIDKCRLVGKPVITATQMLKSMVDYPRPTRAEVSDVAHAVYDGTDAVMLSEETTIGKYPIKCVATQAKIVQFNERFVSFEVVNNSTDGFLSNITNAANCFVSHQPHQIEAMLVFCEDENTIAQVVKSRPNLPVHIVSTKLKVCNKAALYYSAVPHYFDWKKAQCKSFQEIISNLIEEDWLKKNQRILVIYQAQWNDSAPADTMTIIKI